MNRAFFALAAGVVVATVGLSSQVSPAIKDSNHVMANTADLKWAPAPPGLPAGAQVAVVAGDPGKPGQFIMGAKLPNGYKVPPHSHPTDENIVVTSGWLLLGVGDTWNEKSMHAVNPGGAAKMPAKVNHMAMAKGETVFYIIGQGPFEITYVNPSDDPRKSTTK
jgi:quercetin dioxygenase-like cupin family protein